MANHFLKNKKGAVAVLVGIMIAALMGFVGLALDIGNLMVTKTGMQAAVDAAVCGGGLILPDQTQATTVAKALIASNNFDPASATITFNQDVTRNSANAPEINCSLTNNVSTFFMRVFGFQTVPLTVSAEAILIGGSPNGPFNYTIFSGSEVLDLTVNGSQIVKGSIHSNDQLIINGSSNVSGSAEGAKGVTVNGSNTIGSVMADTLQDLNINGSNNIGSKSGGAQDIAMPDYSQQVANTAATTYNTNQTFNGTVDVSGNIYVNGTATLNGSVDSTGAILATGNITVNGSSSISGSNQVCLYSANGNITVNGSSFVGNASSEIIYAPNGTVTINGSFIFQGHIIAKKVTINGSGNFNGKDYPVTSLPIASHVKLIK